MEMFEHVPLESGPFAGLSRRSGIERRYAGWHSVVEYGCGCRYETTTGSDRSLVISSDITLCPLHKV